MTLQLTDSRLAIDFRSVLPHPNFITNIRLGYILTKQGIVEVSKGSGIGPNNILYGVTVVSGAKRCIDLDKCLDSYEEVEEYIKELNTVDTSYLEKLLKQVT